MKKTALLVISLMVLLACTLAGCGNTKAQQSETKTIHIYQFKVEISEPLNKLKAEYEKTHPGIKLDIQSVGGGTDYGASLKAKFASGDQPDIFTNEGYQDRDTWLEYLEDLSDQPWVKDLDDFARKPMTVNGKIYGQPMNLEGFGFVYNKDLFKKAGITKLPQTIDELEEAAKRLKAAGIIPFANGYAEWWVLGNHFINIPFARQSNPESYVADLNKGTARIPGNPVFNQWVKLLDLTIKYGNRNPLTMDYNTQVTLFSTGKAAMMHQGNWTQPQMDGINPNLNLGILPAPIDNDPSTGGRLAVGVASNWVVNKNSPVKQEAKEFLNWLVTSETGKHYITKEFKFVPAFKSITSSDETTGDLGAEISRHVREGKIWSWNFQRFPKGLNQDLSSSMQAYIAGVITKDEMLQQFQEAWDNLKYR
ncbi:Multiple sugar-binding protein [Paenibacillus polymyxa E681]|uniref:ABC transporter substrate-binding protein n=1 Tax=Paenibacillus polymyxa TaxID=1406 RepID=UPI0001E322BA|nr:ABC transporter substrate-binding protein [Paenibacillus polymyxa]ADM72225.1 ABC transporter substrate-binding protein [Paenibacillus polymyxa E681]QNV59250.1 Multiple sugar-binding protein [Paenibacillus polymyxa E681]QNV64076.1 Multiple sugar-binding protein [Paenibacillus polymyxa E681]